MIAGIRTTPLHPRYESLDMWRGVACLLVLLNHATFTTPGGIPFAALGPIGQVWSEIAARLWCGVPIFFVISGYCIAATADSQRRRGRPPLEYFARRFRRIFPPYWIVLLGTVALFTLVDVLLWPGSLSGTNEFLRPWWYSPSQWAGNLTLTELWRPHVFGTAKAMILGHAWTLCYEEQFYLVIGLLLLAAPKRLFVGLAAVTVIVIGIGLVWGVESTGGFFWDGAWFLFVPGITAYYVLNYAERLRYPAAIALSSLALWSARTPERLLELAKNPEQELFIASIFGVVILLLRNRDEAFANAKALRPLFGCGLMCYSLYLVHLPIAILMRGSLAAAAAPQWAWNPALTIPLCAMVSLMVAALFHRHVERRFMNAPSIQPRSSGRPAVQPVGAIAG